MAGPRRHARREILSADTSRGPAAATADSAPAAPENPTRRAHPLRWRLEATATRGVVAALDALPEATSVHIGGSIGRGYSHLDSHLRRLAAANVRLVFPHWSDVEQRELVSRNFAELGRNAAQWARLPRQSEHQIRDSMEFRGIEHLEDALAAGRGVLIATAHYGYWELILRALGIQLPDTEVTAVGREQPNPYLQAMVAQRRSLGDTQPLPQNARSILRALRRNSVVGVLCDHYLSKRRGGILVPFLGLRAWSNPGPATLALRTGCPVVVAHAYRLEAGRHCIEIGAELQRPAGEHRAANIAAFTERINGAIRTWIEERPEAWLWATHRWKASPDAPEDLYASRRRRRRR